MPLFAEALRLNREVLGERHPDTLAILNNYAGLLEALGNADAAEPLYVEALKLRREVLGEGHPDTIAGFHNFAANLQMLGRIVEAEEMFAMALQRSGEVLGERHPALFLGDRMTETAIRSVDFSQTRILHLATHGFTSEEASGLAEPGLVFTPPTTARPEDDGYLAASEIVGIDLSAVQWVILSACNTASPSGQPGETGLSGLAQAFFHAGAQSLLVSHWPVFDEIAPVITVEMLKAAQNGVSRAEALQAAMRSVRLRSELDADHPAVWAPFALVGEGRWASGTAQGVAWLKVHRPDPLLPNRGAHSINCLEVVREGEQLGPLASALAASRKKVD